MHMYIHLVNVPKIKFMFILKIKETSKQATNSIKFIRKIENSLTKFVGKPLRMPMTLIPSFVVVVRVYLKYKEKKQVQGLKKE